MDSIFIKLFSKISHLKSIYLKKSNIFCCPRCFKIVEISPNSRKSCIISIYFWQTSSSFIGLKSSITIIITLLNKNIRCFKAFKGIEDYYTTSFRGRYCIQQYITVYHYQLPTFLPLRLLLCGHLLCSGFCLRNTYFVTEDKLYKEMLLKMITYHCFDTKPNNNKNKFLLNHIQLFFSNIEKWLKQKNIKMIHLSSIRLTAYLNISWKAWKIPKYLQRKL